MRGKRLAPVLAAVGGALVIVIALVVATQVGHHSKKTNASNIQLDSVEAMLKGIPQKGITLGSSTAKLTMVEFVDPQCPYCGDFSRDALPTLIQKYVRTGKLRLELQGLAFVGPDSNRLLGLAEAAGLQNKLWNVLELEYENQGTENSNYATDALLKAIAEAVPGLDANKAFSAGAEVARLLNAGLKGAKLKAALRKNTAYRRIDTALKLAETSLKEILTPSFLLGPTGAKPAVTITNTTDAPSFVKAIDAQLSK